MIADDASGGKQVGAPKGQQQEDKRADRCRRQSGGRTGANRQRDTSSARYTTHMKMDQTTFGSVRIDAASLGSGQIPADGQADGQQNKSGQHQPAGDDFQPLNRRQQRKHGAQLVKFQIVFLRQKHAGRHRAQAERAVGQQNQSRRAGWSGRRKIAASARAAGPAPASARTRPWQTTPATQTRRETAAAATDRRPDTRRRCVQAINIGGFEKIVDRAMIDGEAALEHRRRCAARTRRAAKNNSRGRPGENLFATGKPNTPCSIRKRTASRKK